MTDAAAIASFGTGNSLPGVFSTSACLLNKGPGGNYHPDVVAAGLVFPSRFGWRWLSGEPVYGNFNTILPPNSTSCWTINSSNAPGIYPPTSNHTGGVNVGVMDGSVTFISDTINATTTGMAEMCVRGGISPYGVWGAFGSIDGGESVSPY